MTAGEVADAGSPAPSGGGGPAPGIENDAESGDGDAGAKPEIERARECACALAGARPALNVRTYGDADAGGAGGAALNVVRNGPADGGGARSVCAVGSVRSGGGNAMGSSLLARRRCVIILRDWDVVVEMNE
jgi:hypothetical protein